MSYKVTLSDVFLDDLKDMITAGVKAAIYQDDEAIQEYLETSIYEYDTNIAAVVAEAISPYISKAISMESPMADRHSCKTE